jgi:biopolymer transport protein ExbD
MTQNKSDFKIVLKGDKDVDFGVVEDLMQSLKDTRNTRFSLVTDIDAGEPDKK